MPSPQVVIAGRVARNTQVPYPDDQSTDRPTRLGRYGEQKVESIIPTKHLLADEGSYFSVSNDQTGIATAAAPTAFSATNPFIYIFNSDSPGNGKGKRIYLDFARLQVTAAGTAGASIRAAVTLDNGNRYTSGGTALTSKIANVNMDDPNRSIAQVVAGDLVVAAATGAVRTVEGQIALKGAIGVVLDELTLSFGESLNDSGYALSTILKSKVVCAPVVIGPGQCALIHLWLPSQTAASSYLPTVGWWER